ncbi:unnamed protein product [Gemmata massiliana]|uniref:Uncharacterized protein n=1 Tax=Gemmata massiliana TaxID=1210884 RepID=A0A6P2D8M7_9BACT|nr:unnamed protein product [Gemmata massiliana]
MGNLCESPHPQKTGHRMSKNYPCTKRSPRALLIAVE